MSGPPSDNGTGLPSSAELARLVRERDWSTTPLGPVEAWPQSLRTVVQILLTSRYAMWMGWGSELTFLYNDAYRPTLGLKHPWALGSPADQVWAEIWRDIGPRIDSVLRTGESTYDEGLLLFLERSGFPEETYHTFSYSPLQDDGGNVSGMLCVVTEETERVISERRMATLRDLATGLAAAGTEAEVLSAAQEQLGKNTKDLPFALAYLFDAQGQAALAARTGIAIDHPLAAAVLAPGADAPWPVDALFQGASPSLLSDMSPLSSVQPLPQGFWDKPPSQAAIVLIRQQANERPAGFLVVGLNPYRRYDQAYAGFIELISGQVAAGIANARAYEAERRRAESLAELDRAKTAFFSNVSHEFRTPLTLMLGPLEDMLAQPEGQAGSDRRDLLHVMHRSGMRLQRLVNTLLDFSRIEAGRAQASFEPTDLSAYTAELASSFRSAMERAKLAFTVDCPPLPEPVHVDREMWEKVVLNLLSNAFKYTLEGAVSVRLEARAGAAVLSVEDTGPGIPEAELPRLFERFHRVEGTQARTHEGTGIGLALVQELVKLHGGTVSVSSVVGRGSTFTVALPFGSAHLSPDRIEAGRTATSTALHAEAYVEEALRWLPDVDPASEQRAEPLHVASTGVRSRVLLADDNADMRDYVRRLLGNRYEVVAVADGEEALASALSQPPDLVLSDVMMPRLDGFELLAALRAHESTKTLPVLLLSARAGEEAHVEGLAAGADDYLVKPFSARELLARVEAHLSLARMRKEADQARRLSEARLGLAIEATRLFAWEWDVQRDEVRGAGNMAAIFGAVLASSAEGLRLVHPEDEPAHRAKVERIAREGGSYHSEFRIRRVDTGAIAWIEERATAIANEWGRVVFVVGVLADITERKAAENAMRVGEARQAFLLALSDAIRPLGDPNAIKQAASRVLGERLRANRAFYAEIDGDDWVVEGRYEQGVPSMPPGRYAAGTYGRRIMETYRAGERVIFRDAPTDAGFSPDERSAHIAISILAAVGVPLIKDGKLVAILAVHSAEPRDWTAEEIELIQETAERTWAAVERTRSEQALRDSEARFRTLFEALDEGVMILERLPLRSDGLRDWRYVALNPASQSMFRIGDLTGQTVRDNFPQEDEGWYDIYDRALETGEVARFEREARSQGVVLQMYVARMGEKTHGRIMVVMQDVTERRRAEAALRDSEEQLRLATEHAEIGMWDVDEVNGLLVWPPRVKAMFGISPDVPVSMRDFYEGLHPEDRASTTAAYAAAADPARRALYDVEYRTVGKEDGRIRWVAAKGRGLFDDSARCVRVIGTAIDITERKRMEQALAASEAQLQQVFAQAPVAVAVLRGHELIFELANPYYQDFLPGRELLGKPLAAAMPEVSPELLQVLRRVIDTGEPFVGHEYLVPIDRDRDGVIEDCWFTFVYQPWRQLDGSVIGVVVVAVDVTTHVRARRELERVNKELEEFAYVASHDLQEPLRMVNIYSQLLLRTCMSDAPEAEEYAQFVRQGVKRMETLIRDLLTYSRTVQRREEMPVGTADLAAALSEAESVLQSRIDEDSGVVAAGPLPTVRGDTKQLAHVFQNLLSNALKYRGKDRVPEIQISAERQGDQWIVSVRDNGIGFEQQHAERIFGLFKRLHKDEYPGTGLGLAICQRIVERYGGRMWAEGEVDKGATFFFALPAAEGE